MLGKSWYQAEKRIKLTLKSLKGVALVTGKKVDDKYPGTTTTDSVEEETLPPIVDMSTRETT